MKKIVKLNVVALLIAFLLILMACNNNANQITTAQTETVNETSAIQTTAAETNAAANAQGKPATWIADRTVTVQAYVGDIGFSLPENQQETPIFKEFKERTGIDIVVQYTPGKDDESVMATQLAAGSIPDVVVSYLNDSTRPEMPILLRAARDDMFADLSPFLANSKVYSKYLTDGFLPNDSAKNIVFRDDFNGAVYILHLQIAREDETLNWRPDIDLRGGLYIQTKIAEELGIDVKTINTQDQFYDLLVKIKESGYTDDNGQLMDPLGPKYCGGSVDALAFMLRGFDWGVSDGYNYIDGKVLHESQTDYAMKKVNYFRKLLAEGLVNPEYFTMDGTRANEYYLNHSAAIMGDCHNFMEIIYSSDDWIPLGPLADYNGDIENVSTGKSGYGCWSISAKAKNPDEIFALIDYMATKEGKMLCQYGIEGVSYDMVNGMPRINEHFQTLLDNGDSNALINQMGAGFGGAGFDFFSYMQTDNDPVADFGESRPGSGSATTFARAIEISAEYPHLRRLVPGLNATAYLTDPSMADIKPQLDLLKYKEILVQAMYADTDDEAKKIMDSFRQQLESAGVGQFEDLVKNIYENDKNAVKFY